MRRDAQAREQGSEAGSDGDGTGRRVKAGGVGMSRGAEKVGKVIDGRGVGNGSVGNEGKRGEGKCGGGGVGESVCAEA